MRKGRQAKVWQKMTSAKHRAASLEWAQNAHAAN